MSNVSALSLIDPLLNDPLISEILIDDFDRVYVEKEGQLEDIPSPFASEAQVYELITEITKRLGRVVDESCPFMDFRLEDGSRLHIVIPPIALSGPSLTIRKYDAIKLNLEKLINFGSLSPAMAGFLKICVQARLNILVSGGTGSGKTTLLRIFAEMIPPDERVILIQKTSEMTLPHRHLVSLETRPPDMEGRGEVTMTDLVNNAMYMRPDRIVVGVTGGEVFDLVSAMSSGFDGTLIALQANNSRDAIDRFEGMASIGNPAMPLLMIRQLVAEAINIIVHQERLSDGSRKVVAISEVLGIENNQIDYVDLYQFRKTGVENGKITGAHSATGVIPQFLSKLQAAGFTSLPMEMFTPLFKPTT
jgi:pilus assembly protein CpaF